jgi:hypothetical protein
VVLTEYGRTTLLADIPPAAAALFVAEDQVTSVSGLKVLAHEALKLLVYEALRYQCMRPCATSAWGLTLLVHEALRY